MKKILLMTSLLFCSTSFGHGNAIEAVDLAVSASLERFGVTESQSTLANFQGIKSWVSGAEVKVRIYVRDMEDINYTCFMDHDAGASEKMTCK